MGGAAVKALQGRGREVQALEDAVVRARGGTSAVLVLRGDAGIGKTALLAYAGEAASGFRTLAITGVESEIHLPFASLEQLCTPLLKGLDALPRPQADALSVAFGLCAGEAPHPFLVGLAVLNLLANAADGQPTALLIDDTHWIDEESRQVLAFVARRIKAESLLMIFAEREPGLPELADLPELSVHGLSEPDSRELLGATLHAPLDPQVRDQIVKEAQGNPMALLQLPRAGLTDLAGGYAQPGTQTLAKNLEDAFHRRFTSLPQETQRLLVIAAADPTGDAALLRRAAAAQQIPADAAAAAEIAGLVEIDGRVRFHHPLVRSAIYQRTLPPERRAAHQALADATDARFAPDRKAWHGAQAASGPDEEIAQSLEASADRAQSRGGAAAAAAFLRRSAELTADPARRVSRALAAAQLDIDAGGAVQAQNMVALAEGGPLDDLQRARLERLRARLIFSQVRGSAAPKLLLQAAQRLVPLDAALARDTLLEAVNAAVFAGHLSEGLQQRTVALAARSGPPASTPPRTVDVLLDTMTNVLVDGYAASVDSLRNALQVVRRDQRSEATDIERRYLWLACPVTPEPLAPELWDDEAWHTLAADAVRIARETGALSVLPMSLTYQASYHVHAGNFTTATALIDEASAISQAAGSPPMIYPALLVNAWQAEESAALDVIQTGIKDAGTRGEGRTISFAEYATSVLYNGLGRYDAALTAARRACQYEDLGFYGWALLELVEAAARSGQPGAATEAMAALTERTTASGTNWALGTQACARALLTEDHDADAHYQEAIDRLSTTRIATQLARTRLLYGEWLRRQGRRRESRAQLRASYDFLHRIGAAGFAERARRELLATGEPVRKRTSGTMAGLTSQEAHIAKLVRSGLSNAEIAAQMFISPRTVEWHLGNVFSKLGVASRSQLRSLASPSLQVE
ncbi:AAA family ATPase [Streptomyces sp. NPDC007856]|uniref:helix-turn-helix transcriptional regulator n=1 Tax=Streptomyces sp. NPDC007856 TaxID=3364781 RepID=UPI003699E67C